MTCVTTLVLLFACFPFQADDRTKDDGKSDHKLIQGKWERVSQHFNGTKQKPRKVVLHFSKDEATSDFGARKFTYKLDSTKTPKHMDRSYERNGAKETRKYIYSLEGDTLKICRNRLKDVRPTKFEAKEGDGQAITVFNRIKQK